MQTLLQHVYRTFLLHAGVDPGISFRVGTFCLLISNFNTYNTSNPHSIVLHSNKKYSQSKLLTSPIQEKKKKVTDQ